MLNSHPGHYNAVGAMCSLSSEKVLECQGLIVTLEYLEEYFHVICGVSTTSIHVFTQLLLEINLLFLFFHRYLNN